MLPLEETKQSPKSTNIPQIMSAPRIMLLTRTLKTRGTGRDKGRQNIVVGEYLLQKIVRILNFGRVVSRKTDESKDFRWLLTCTNNYHPMPM